MEVRPGQLERQEGEKKLQTAEIKFMRKTARLTLWSHFPLLRSIIQRISPCPRLLVNSHNKIIFYGEELLAPRPTPKLEDHPLSAVRDCLFQYIRSNPPYLEAVPSIRNLRTRHAVVTRDPPNMGSQ
jgi:hypothetical protein